MDYTTLISAEELKTNLDNPQFLVIDCQFIMAEPDKGKLLYQAAHIPGAVYAHLNQDLTGQIIPGKTSRHPLPPIESLIKTFSRLGIGDSVQVVAYDNYFNAFAARLWWMLHWLGHEKAAVLDGGISHWQELGYPTVSEIETRSARTFEPDIQPDMLVTVDEIVSNPNMLLVDSRSPERYRGEEEPFDKVAGHIPGAVNAYYQLTLQENNTFHDKTKLQEHYKGLFGHIGEKPTFYCGSGVTALVNALAYKHAGLGDAKVFAGSWSEWITDPERPIALGNEK